MKLDSRVTIHAGINYVLAPFAGLDRPSCFRFQEQLEELGFRVSEAHYEDHALTLIQVAPTKLQVKITVAGPQVGQLLLIAPQPQHECSLEIVEAVAEDVTRAYDAIWGLTGKQILSCDATLRDLYDTSSEHAFIELWERRLHQSPGGLQMLGRPILGGGLRLVMPPVPGDPSGPVVELKIESLLADTSKIYVEVQFFWKVPAPAGTSLDPTGRLGQVDLFICNQVVDFMSGGDL